MTYTQPQPSSLPHQFLQEIETIFFDVGQRETGIVSDGVRGDER
jgi:hypothetical protein